MSSSSRRCTQSSQTCCCFHNHRHRLKQHTPLTLNSATVSIPHPDKKYKRGEDAFFTSDKGIGVFDGVGGWAIEGIDAGLYSKGLAKYCATHLKRISQSHRLLTGAVASTSAKGSSTALLAVLHDDNNTLNICNVGDCVLIIIRDGVVVFQTMGQQHSFNFPHQLQFDLRDDLETADVHDVSIQHGDIVIAATDGVWDNINLEDVLDCVTANAKLESSVKERKSFAMKVQKRHVGGEKVFPYEKLHSMAFDIASRACEVAHNEYIMSPFSKKAEYHGFDAPGGKLDDITVVVAVARRSRNSYHASFYTDCFIDNTVSQTWSK